MLVGKLEDRFIGGGFRQRFTQKRHRVSEFF